MVESTRSAAAFFRDCLSQALRSRRLQASELAESYLVQLLTDITSPRRSAYGPDRRTLVDMLREAHEARGFDKARVYREIGDSALVGSGVFRERLVYQGVSLSYYQSVGGSAYRQAGHLHRVLRVSPIDELCLELGAKFTGLADALEEAATLGVETTDVGLIRLLGRFQRAGRPWMRGILLRGGLDPDAS
jgi:hypothetical protein